MSDGVSSTGWPVFLPATVDPPRALAACRTESVKMYWSDRADTTASSHRNDKRLLHVVDLWCNFDRFSRSEFTNRIVRAERRRQLDPVAYGS